MKSKVKISILLLIISIFLFFFVFIWSGEKKDYYKIYYYICALFIILSIINFYLSKNIKIYFYIFLISSLFALYIVEFYITIIKYRTDTKIIDKKLNKIDEQIKTYENLTGKIYDTRTKYKVYLDEKEKNKKTVVTVFPHFFAQYDPHANILPLSGISKSHTIYCNENGYYSSYQSDRYGFNNPDAEWDYKEIEYLLIGGSFVQGACVNEPDDIASVLRFLSKKSVLNLGIGGNGMLLQLASLKEYLQPSVKNVLWFYYEFNMLDLKRELNFNSKILKSYLDNKNFSQNLRHRQEEVDKAGYDAIKDQLKYEDEDKEALNNTIKQEVKNFENEKITIKLSKFLKLHNIRKQFLYLSHTPYPEKEFTEILKQAKELTEKNGSNFYIIFIPTHERYIKTFGNTFYDIKYDLHSYVKKIANELNIPFIDLHNDFFNNVKNYKDFLPFGTAGGHYNPYGYNKITMHIYKSISR
jgi:hypothetical protein